MSSMNILSMPSPLLLFAPRRRSSSEKTQRPQRSGGRAWINGREVGGTEARFAHLSSGSD